MIILQIRILMQADLPDGAAVGVPVGRLQPGQVPYPARLRNRALKPSHMCDETMGTGVSGLGIGLMELKPWVLDGIGVTRSVPLGNGTAAESTPSWAVSPLDTFAVMDPSWREYTVAGMTVSDVCSSRPQHSS
ncbi:hypothetical protein LIP_1242 [Limnochorda pilosa]|uniref:Uncharacterized protein n=1 Tax=Limnochorda pilosa TaxID=1555112 RepID=A0A0K2SJS5_LIMPI|nr:hypothetical protein LIP_1242 [Limnochorda pilosa]